MKPFRIEMAFCIRGVEAILEDEGSGDTVGPPVDLRAANKADEWP